MRAGVIFEKDGVYPALLTIENNLSSLSSSQGKALYCTDDGEIAVGIVNLLNLLRYGKKGGDCYDNSVESFYDGRYTYVDPRGPGLQGNMALLTYRIHKF